MFDYSFCTVPKIITVFSFSYSNYFKYILETLLFHSSCPNVVFSEQRCVPGSKITKRKRCQNEILNFTM